MMRGIFASALIGGVLTLGLAAPAAADRTDDIATFSIIDQLRCAVDPNALPAIAYLAKRRLIDLRKNIGGDSVSCFALRRPYELDGLPVIGICGSSEDGLVHALWPDVFYRGPGTSPGVLLSIATTAPLATVSRWASTHGIPAYTIGESAWFEGAIEVECGSLARH